MISRTSITEWEEVLETWHDIFTDEELLSLCILRCCLVLCEVLWEFSVDLDTSHRPKFEFFWIIKCRLKQLLYTFICTEISWTKELVDRIEGLHTSFCLIFLESERDMLGDPLIFSLEFVQYFCIRLISPCSQEYWDRYFSFFVDFHIDDSSFLDLDLEPWSTLRDDLHCE